MQSTKDQIITRTYVLSDLLALLVAFLVATEIAGKIQTGFSVTDTLSTRYSIGNVAGFLVLIGLWLLVYQWMGLYQPRKPLRFRTRKLRVDLAQEATVIGTASAIGSVIFAAASSFFNITLLLTPFFFIVFFPCVTLVDLLLRRITLYSLTSVNLGDRNERNVIVIGSNQAAFRYAKMVKGNHELGYRLRGFLDDIVVHKKSTNFPYLGKLDDFPTLLKDMIVDEVVIVMPIHASKDKITHVIALAYQMGISVRFPATQLFNEIAIDRRYRIRMEPMPARRRSDVGMDLVISAGHQFGLTFIAKRLLDVFASALLIILSAPIMLAAALLIVLSTGWPVLFIQERYGYNRRIFDLYKFRTMVKGADALQEGLRSQNERSDTAFKMKKDPRITAVGRWLRKTNLDELPQLFNILKGDMSLVGPRPVSLSDYTRIDAFTHRRRLSVLPGLTGTWQIAPGREKISFEEWVRMDLEYIDNWRFGTDLAILAKTVPVVLFGRGDR